MSPRTLRLLLGILTALVAIWATVKVASSRKTTAGTTPSARVGMFFNAVSATSVRQVRLRGPRDTVTLAPGPSPNAWTVNGFRADSGAVARLWEAVDTARASGDVVATSAATHQRLGLSADSARVVDFTLNDKTRTIVVGKVGNRPHTTYVRFPDSDTAYQVNGELQLRVSYSRDDWRDRRILAADTGAVARVFVSLDGQSYTVVKRNGEWRFADGAAVDTTSIRILLTELHYLHAAGFLEKQDSIAIKPRGGSVVATSAGGDTLALLTLGRGGDRWATSRGDSTLYRLAYYRVERVAPTRQKLTRYRQ